MNLVEIKGHYLDPALVKALIPVKVKGQGTAMFEALPHTQVVLEGQQPLILELPPETVMGMLSAQTSVTPSTEEAKGQELSEQELPYEMELHRLSVSMEKASATLAKINDNLFCISELMQKLVFGRPQR